MSPETGVTTLWGYQVVFAVYNNSVLKLWGKEIISKVVCVQIYNKGVILSSGKSYDL